MLFCILSTKIFRKFKSIKKEKHRYGNCKISSHNFIYYLMQNVMTHVWISYANVLFDLDVCISLDPSNKIGSRNAKKRKTIINAIKLIFRNILLSDVQKRINIVNPICVSIRVCQVYTKEENPLRNIFWKGIIPIHIKIGKWA